MTSLLFHMFNNFISCPFIEIPGIFSVPVNKEIILDSIVSKEQTSSSLILPNEIQANYITTTGAILNY